jgi:hypothetical protein
MAYGMKTIEAPAGTQVPSGSTSSATAFLMFCKFKHSKDQSSNAWAGWMEAQSLLHHSLRDQLGESVKLSNMKIRQPTINILVRRVGIAKHTINLQDYIVAHNGMNRLHQQAFQGHEDSD